MSQLCFSPASSGLIDGRKKPIDECTCVQKSVKTDKCGLEQRQRLRERERERLRERERQRDRERERDID